MKVAPLPEEAPVSTMSDESNDDPRAGITSIGNLGPNYLTNAAPCLEEIPEESYELDLTFNKELTIPFTAFDFEEDEITLSFTSDAEELGCADCISIEEDFEGSTLVITTVADDQIEYIFDSETGEPMLD